ncbi:MAG: uridine diphosphate-N-acetylglucosamine-binding protein YvcK [Actinomycetota bacterium]|nr:uridine diphosphate-N-acetylglucosamine-binding protein YvcK [Actinomycetota bacterium]
MTRVVALGGGHGLAATLAAARLYADDVCAIVSVADDGGSSGRLRDAFGIPAPGDVRRCLVALADPDSIWTRAFEHRFDAGDLEGHAFGNLVLTGLAASTGDFEAALAEAGRLLGAVGRVMPATIEPVVLKAEIRSLLGGGGNSITGQVAVGRAEGITGVSIVPADAQPPAAALAALAAADQVVLGPGSLFTSILAVVAVTGICHALATTPGRKVYVCNLRPQMPETAGYDVAAHVDALRAHGLDVDVVLCHPGSPPRGRLDIECVERPVARQDGLGHDPVLLAAALAELVG